MTDTSDTLPILPTNIDHLYYSFDECLTPVIKYIDDKLSEELDFVIRTQLKDFKEGLLGVQERVEARLKGGDAHQEEEFAPIVYVVEGIDGSGKTTLKRRLGEKYKEEEELEGRLVPMILRGRRLPSASEPVTRTSEPVTRTSEPGTMTRRKSTWISVYSERKCSIELMKQQNVPTIW